MSLVDVEQQIDAMITSGPGHPLLAGSLGTGPDDDHQLYVIKYLAPRYLSDVLTTQRLFASSAAARTWGDAIYVAPIALPQTTMMYGAAGVVGKLDVSNVRFFDATDPVAIDLYQKWIGYFSSLFRQLTTTVHANEANRELRNKFRTRFSIDCVLFRPDEPCRHYVDGRNDLWLAVTHRNHAGQVAYGASDVIKDLLWCAIATDSFESEDLGFRALFHTGLTAGKNFISANYSSLGGTLKAAHVARNQIAITSF